ncbi:CLUMA_CG020866, isoform A, partial [Clunio marinus]
IATQIFPKPNLIFPVYIFFFYFFLLADDVQKIEAVVGKSGQLSCNLTSDIQDDRVALVIWYKEGKTTPIYSYDARDSKAIDGGSHHGISINGKFYFNTSSLNPAIFSISNLTADDKGIYRCRVDFTRTPTKNTKFNLSVIIPPENLLILNEQGKHISHYILGPYNEGSSINLTCISSGGDPLPKLTWRHDNQLLEGILTKLSEKKMRNVLHLKNLNRKDLLSSFTCKSTNNNLTDPITSSVMIDLNLRPLTVKIIKDLKFMSTKQLYDLRCEVRGSRPAPQISWWLGSEKLTAAKETTTKDLNLTSSILPYHPKIEDQGKFLSCRAENPLIPDSGNENGFKLNLHHPPLITLEFGTNPVVEGNTVNEGADVYFECNIKANPSVYRVGWRHNDNDNELQNNPQEGIIISNQSLVLQNITRQRMGQYVCTASNSEGDGFSQPVQLNVLYSPICRPGLPQTYNVDRGETATIQCEVESNPAAFDYRWKFNTTLVDFTDLHTSIDVKSFFRFKPQTENDYGTVLCWGINSIGMQTEPCLFQVVPAGKPEALTNCSVGNQTQFSFQVTCVEGEDGGYPQDFIAELYFAREKFVKTSISSRTPTFDLKGLNPGSEYEVVLSAVNKKGRSMPFSLLTYTLKVPEKHTDLAATVTTTLMQKRELLMMLAGSIIGIISIALMITIAARLRGSRRLDSKPMVSSLPSIPHNADIMDHHQQQRQHQQESPDSADKNPDIIPHTLEEWQEASKQIYGSMHYRIPTMQPQAAAAAASVYNSTANNMIIYSDATLGRPHMNNNFKRIDSNGICAQQQFDLTSLPIEYQQGYLQQQSQLLHHRPNNTQIQRLFVGHFPNPLTSLNTATLDRFPPPISPSLFASTSSSNPVCSSNEPRLTLKTVPETSYYNLQSMSNHETSF